MYRADLISERPIDADADVHLTESLATFVIETFSDRVTGCWMRSPGTAPRSSLRSGSADPVQRSNCYPIAPH